MMRSFMLFAHPIQTSQRDSRVILAHFGIGAVFAEHGQVAHLGDKLRVVAGHKASLAAADELGRMQREARGDVRILADRLRWEGSGGVDDDRHLKSESFPLVDVHWTTKSSDRHDHAPVPIAQANVARLKLPGIRVYVKQHNTITKALRSQPCSAKGKRWHIDHILLCRLKRQL